MHYIIDTLNKNGYEDYFVGGCVRDKLLNRKIHLFLFLKTKGNWIEEKFN